MIKSIAFVPGKNIFYTSGQDGKILKWILDGSSDNFEVIYSGTNSIEVLALSPDATWLAAGGDNSTIRMIPLIGNVPGYELKGHTNIIKSIVFSYDGKYIYSAALDGNVLKWDLAARTSRNINDNTVRITQIDVSGSNKFIAGVSEKGKVLIFDQEADSGVFSLDTKEMEITSIRFYPGKNILAIGDINGFIELWDVEKRVRVGDVKAHETRVSTISFNPVFNQMATGSFDKTVKIWNPDNFTEPPLSFSDNNEKILAIEFSSNGEALVSATTLGEMKSRASTADILAGNICFLVTRNLSTEEWSVYVGEDIPLEKTCADKETEIKVEKK
jgi:WD40 repeat protein